MVAPRILKTILFAGALVATAGMGVAAWAADSGRGPTRGFFVRGFPTGISEPIGTDFTQIQVLPSLPPGSYIANASAVVVSSDPEIHFVACVFTIGGAFNESELVTGMVGGTGRDNFLSLPQTIGFTIRRTQDLGVACTTDVPNVVFSQASPLTAIRVDRLRVELGGGVSD